MSRLLHTELHWLNVSERVKYKLSVMGHSCLKGQALQYLTDFCIPRTAVTSRQRLRSASRQLLDLPRYRLSSFARRAFSVTGPSVWNSLPEYLRDPAVGRDSFRKQLKTLQRTCTNAYNALENVRYTNSHYIHVTISVWTNGRTNGTTGQHYNAFAETVGWRRQKQ